MTLYQNKYRIESARHPTWDYFSAGWYFVPFCTHDRQHFFGRIVAGEMQPSPAGEIVNKIWWEIPQRFDPVSLDAFVAMPNHIHGIIVIHEQPCQQQRRRAGLPNITTRCYPTIPWAKSFGGTKVGVPLKFDRPFQNLPGNPIFTIASSGATVKLNRFGNTLRTTRKNGSGTYRL
ncbi:transposase [Leptolyngbya sp. 'hensonii']|uniref:transposase n=1 Tax=Leptolyngbya sp. 'hensonii' TaxID=1922337 RepID=UPI000AAD9B05|nr:transposase [Leptolyngbya sp. 'hensonii']